MKSSDLHMSDGGSEHCTPVTVAQHARFLRRSVHLQQSRNTRISSRAYFWLKEQH